MRKLYKNFISAFSVSTTITLFSISSLGAMPIEGSWIMKKAICKSDSDKTQGVEFKMLPIPNSEFSPDIMLQFKLKESVTVTGNPVTTYNLETKKVASTASCTNPALRDAADIYKDSGILKYEKSRLFTTTLDQEVYFSDESGKFGYFTKNESELEPTFHIGNTNSESNPDLIFDCDLDLGLAVLKDAFLHTLLGTKRHVDKENERYYDFKIQDNKMELSYFEETEGAHCPSPAETVLIFSKAQ